MSVSCDTYSFHKKLETNFFFLSDILIVQLKYDYHTNIILLHLVCHLTKTVKNIELHKILKRTMSRG